MEHLTPQFLFVLAILAVGSWTVGKYIGRTLIDLGVYVYNKSIMRERELIFDAIAEYEYARNQLKYKDDWAYSYAQQYACDIVGNVVIYYKNEDKMVAKLSPGRGFEKIDN